MTIELGVGTYLLVVNDDHVLEMHQNSKSYENNQRQRCIYSTAYESHSMSYNQIICICIQKQIYRYFLQTDSTRKAIGLFRLLVQWSGTLCQMNSEIHHVVLTVSNSSLKQSCLDFTSRIRALKGYVNVMCYINSCFTYSQVCASISLSYCLKPNQNCH